MYHMENHSLLWNLIRIVLRGFFIYPLDALKSSYHEEYSPLLLLPWTLGLAAESKVLSPCVNMFTLRTISSFEEYNPQPDSIHKKLAGNQSEVGNYSVITIYESF